MNSLFRINMINVLKSPGLWIGTFFILIFMIAEPTSFYRFSGINHGNLEYLDYEVLVASSILITGVLITVMTIFGETYVRNRDSLIYTNIQLKDKPKSYFYTATILPVIIYTILVLLFGMILLTILDKFMFKGIQQVFDGGPVPDPKLDHWWTDVNWGTLVYSTIITVLLGLSIAWLISVCTNNYTTYITIAWAYLLVVFFVGGSSIPIFLIRNIENAPISENSGGNHSSQTGFRIFSYLVPNTFSNYLFANSMAGCADLFPNDTNRYIVDKDNNIQDAVISLLETITFMLIALSVKSIRKK